MLRRWDFRLVPSERSLEAVGESVRLHIISRSKVFDLFPRTYKGKNRCVSRRKHALINSRERPLKSDINLEQSSHIVITDCKSNKLNSFTYYLNKEVPVIDQLIQQLQRAAESCVNLLGIGIGLSAEIKHEEQIVKSCAFYDWHNVNLKEIIERQFMVFTYIDHRANGIAVRENLMGHGKHLNNILCLHESAIDKAVLILSGKICRGELNCNGTIDPKFLLKNLSTIKQFVDVSHILIGYCTEALEIETRQLVRLLRNQIICYPEAENCIELGMATVAEIEWFESIYFML
ncbi:ROK family protein [Tepidanaerobacter sp. EBM-49]|uniref:ROK family protein n=1 Tax=Tepidanaerobacter sp. EBM-49 TaxID=1918504 RepID=UPI000A75C895|nr:ROK family protein [Tepidanaerobacter sp. EBM-49]